MFITYYQLLLIVLLLFIMSLFYYIYISNWVSVQCPTYSILEL